MQSHPNLNDTQAMTDVLYGLVVVHDMGYQKMKQKKINAVYAHSKVHSP